MYKRASRFQNNNDILIDKTDTGETFYDSPIPFEDDIRILRSINRPSIRSPFEFPAYSKRKRNTRKQSEYYYMYDWGNLKTHSYFAVNVKEMDKNSIAILRTDILSEGKRYYKENGIKTKIGTWLSTSGDELYIWRRDDKYKKKDS